MSRKLVGALALGLVSVCSAFTLTGCASAGPPHELRIERNEVPGIAAEMECERVFHIFDDVYFHDAMTGFDCVQNDGVLTMVRVYEASESVPFVLNDWSELLDEARQLMVGSNWFAIGAPARLAEVGEALGVEPIVGVSTPRNTADLTHDQQRVVACSVGVVSIVRDNAMRPDAYDQSAAESYEPYFPGIVSFAESVADRINSVNDQEFEYQVTRFGAEIKAFCAPD